MPKIKVGNSFLENMQQAQTTFFGESVSIGDVCVTEADSLES